MKITNSRIAALALVAVTGVMIACNSNGDNSAQRPERPPLTAGNIRAELVRMMDEQQAARELLDSMVAKHGWEASEALEAQGNERYADSANMARLDAYVIDHGWPGRSTVGDQASFGAFLILQHSQIDIQQRYLPLLREQASRNEIPPPYLAMFEDRVLMRQDKPQTYGTQLWNDPSTGQLGLYPVDDPDNVDERRASVGLGPLDEHLAQFGVEKPTAEESAFPDSADN